MQRWSPGGGGGGDGVALRWTSNPIQGVVEIVLVASWHPDKLCCTGQWSDANLT